MFNSLNPRDMVFIIDLPTHIAEFLDRKDVRAETQTEVTKLFDEQLKVYKKRQTISKKVIAYKIAINCDLYGKDRPEEHHIRRDDIKFCDGTALSIGYHILNESDFQGKKIYHYVDSNKFTRMESNWNIIEWTEKRENFFKRTERDLEDLILIIDKFFGDTERALSFIDTGKTLFLEQK